jgi:hypothetical protein
LFENNDIKYAIRLKINKTLLENALEKDDLLMIAVKRNAVDYNLQRVNSNKSGVLWQIYAIQSV